MARGKIIFKPCKNCSYAMRSSVSRKNADRSLFHEPVLNKNCMRGGSYEKKTKEYHKSQRGTWRSPLVTLWFSRGGVSFAPPALRTVYAV
jgi:hypothetical protein